MYYITIGGFRLPIPGPCRAAPITKIPCRNLQGVSGGRVRSLSYLEGTLSDTRLLIFSMDSALGEVASSTQEGPDQDPAFRKRKCCVPVL